jgi:hypothetical protein
MNELLLYEVCLPIFVNYYYSKKVFNFVVLINIYICLEKKYNNYKNSMLVNYQVNNVL